MYQYVVERWAGYSVCLYNSDLCWKSALFIPDYAIKRLIFSFVFFFVTLESYVHTHRFTLSD